MPNRTVTTTAGTTVTLTERHGETLVLLDHPDAPADMRSTEAGRILDSGFQPRPFVAWALKPEVLRAIADLIEKAARARLIESEPPEYWIAGRDNNGDIRLNGGQGVLVAEAADTREDIQGWLDRCDNSRYRPQYIAALALLDAEAVNHG